MLPEKNQVHQDLKKNWRSLEGGGLIRSGFLPTLAVKPFLGTLSDLPKDVVPILVDFQLHWSHLGLRMKIEIGLYSRKWCFLVEAAERIDKEFDAMKSLYSLTEAFVWPEKNRQRCPVKGAGTRLP